MDTVFLDPVFWAPGFWAVAIAAVLFAGISKGGFGSSASFAAAPMLALVLPPAQAVGLLLPLLMVQDLGALWPYWRRWDKAAARALVLGAVPGVALGALVFGIANAALLKLLIGLVALGFVAWRLWGRLRPMAAAARGRAGIASGYGWGLAAGFTSFISHAGGPPATVFLLARGLDKTAFQATTVFVFWAINMMKLGPYLALGVISPALGLVGLMLVPVALAGVWAGVRLHAAVSERVFFALTYLLLAVTGGKLVFDALA